MPLNNHDKIKRIEEILNGIARKDKIFQMESYMRNQFKYIGVGTLERRAATKPIIDELLFLDYVDFEFVFLCFAHEKREFQNLAVDYLNKALNKLSLENINQLYQIIQLKSWWDTVDELSHVAGYFTHAYPETKETMLKWSKDNNLWVRRVAILHQLMKKKDLDTKLLEEIIVNNLSSKEFFINKAIGWILRDYSYTNPSFVLEFIAKYQDRLSALSIREGLKRINKK